MRKYLILTSLLTLTGCMGGGSADGLLLLFGNDKSSEPVRAGTPQETLEANSSITKMQTLDDSTTRIKEIYEESGLSYTDTDVEIATALGIIPNIWHDDLMSEQYRNMSDEDKKTLRKAQLGFKKIMVLRDYMGGVITDFTQSDLEEATKMLNAFYKIESNGRIEQKFNIDNLPNVTNISGLQDFFYDNVSGGTWYLDSISRLYIDGDGELWGTYDRLNKWGMYNGAGLDWFDIRLDEDGKITAIGTWSAGLYVRQGNTNEFKDDANNKITLETFGNGKLSYSDFGYITTENDTGSIQRINTFAMMTGSNSSYSIETQDSMPYINNRIMNFKGTAVGLFVNNPDGDPNELAHTTKMRTDNATLHIKEGDNWSTTLTMPFSEDGWYDVKMTEGDNGYGWYGNTTFSNYHGDNDTKKIVPSNSVNYATISADPWKAGYYEYALENPTEVAGRAYVDFGDPNVRFEAAFGMKPEE